MPERRGRRRARRRCGPLRRASWAPRPAPSGSAGQSREPTLLRPLAEYEALVGGGW